MVCRLTGNINVGDEQSGDNWSVKCSKTNYQHEEEQEVAGLHEKQRKFGFGLIVAMREIQTLDLLIERRELCSCSSFKIGPGVSTLPGLGLGVCTQIPASFPSKHQETSTPSVI